MKTKIKKKQFSSMKIDISNSYKNINYKRL